MENENKHEIKLEVVEEDVYENEMDNSDDIRIGPEVVDYHREMVLKKKILVFVIIVAFAGGVVFSTEILNDKGVFDRFKKNKGVPIETLKAVELSEYMGVSGETDSKVEDKNEISTDEKVADKKNVKILALNGGGGSGAAGKMKTFLEKANYLNVDAENAEKTDYSGVKIFYNKDNLKDFAEELKDSIKKKYSNVSISAGSSKEEKSSDIVVIIGAGSE